MGRQSNLLLDFVKYHVLFILKRGSAFSADPLISAIFLICKLVSDVIIINFIYKAFYQGVGLLGTCIIICQHQACCSLFKKTSLKVKHRWQNCLDTDENISTKSQTLSYEAHNLFTIASIHVYVSKLPLGACSIWACSISKLRKWIGC